jgi:phenylpropionate dioxygenase-like ring-hydroxylating dioxygenase large terminal subunit
MTTGELFPPAIASSLRDGRQLPAHFYTDPSIYELEKTRILQRSWQFVARLEQLRETGSFVTAQLGDVPVVVVRDAEGRLRCHVNVCLHRLHPVAQGTGCSKQLQCSYHGWTYSLDGSLRAVPHARCDPGFSTAGLRLDEVNVGVCGDLVFANADPAAAPLSEILGAAEDEVARFSRLITGWKPNGTFTYDVAGNWKLFMENSLECYHCDLVHRDSLAQAFNTSQRHYQTTESGPVLTQHAPVRTAPSAEVRLPENLEGFRFLYVWPLTSFSVDDYVAAIARLTPTGPRSCRFVVDTLAHPDAPPQAVEEWVAMYDRTFNEDKAVVAAQQAGYDSGRVSAGRILAPAEPAIRMFQRRTFAALAGQQA